MGRSRWLKMDLHIHSHESKRTKSNDYDGEDLSYEKLINALEREKVNFFSITDHNTVNVKLYNELINKRDDLIEKNMNFIIGAELDFFDQEVHDKKFHMLTFFDTYDLNKITQILANLFKRSSNEEIDQNVEPLDLKRFFKEVFSSGIENLITIPHFNNKDKGIPSDGNIDKFVYTVFNGLEDSNNRPRLVESIKVYKKYNYVDVPVVVFSDNHNIDIYPCGKDENLEKQTSMYVMGNIEYPFESIKASFFDVNTRVSIENTQTRSRDFKTKYIKKIELDDQTIDFSPYQNSIIGGFGTGKSFLLDLIINGKNNVNEDKYKDLASKYDNFSIEFYDDTKRSSLSEVKEEVKIIRFNQYKDIYFKNVLYREEKKMLEKNLHIEFPDVEDINKEDIKDDIVNLTDCFINLKNNINNTSEITDIINYHAISRSDEKGYTYKKEEIEPVYKKTEYHDDFINNLSNESDRKIMKTDFYKKDAKESIRNVRDIIITRNGFYKIISGRIEKIIDKIDDKILATNESVKKMDSTISSSLKIWDDVKTDINNYFSLLERLKNESEIFEYNFSDSKYNEFKDLEEVNNFHSYKLTAKYNAENEKPDYYITIFKRDNRESSFYKSILSTIKEDDTFTQSQTFKERVDKYLEEFYGNFNKVCFDILDEDLSILKKSAGEKANVIINLIFNIIEEYSNDNVSSIVILDQPEDNLDNKGIKNEVVDRIRRMKRNNSLPQVICVTHNANISITADSENIIVAKKDSNKCYYNNSGIEDRNFIKEVCRTIEGGVTALRKRGIKFNIPMIKDIEKGE